jgi:hypothetical protein
VRLVDVRRLAALDMWGTAGTSRRRRLIRAEFVLGAAGCLLVGTLVLASGASGVWRVVGIWLLGAGANYVPLALYAQELSRPRALEEELRGADTRRELRRAGVEQLWLAVPFAVAVAAAAQERGRGRRGRSGGG